MGLHSLQGKSVTCISFGTVNIPPANSTSKAPLGLAVKRGIQDPPTLSLQCLTVSQ